jgi:hypothetical protein
MKKKLVKKLALSRETLRALRDEEATKLIRGGGTGYEEDTCIKSCQCTHDL